MLTVRPKVAELVFQVYGRPLHPELFEVCQSRVIERGEYQAKIDVTIENPGLLGAGRKSWIRIK